MSNALSVNYLNENILLKGDVLNCITITELILLVLLRSEAGRVTYNERTGCFVRVNMNYRLVLITNLVHNFFILLYIHYITLRYVTLHYITLHYITLHYITLHYIMTLDRGLW